MLKGEFGGGQRCEESKGGTYFTKGQTKQQKKRKKKKKRQKRGGKNLAGIL